jgi:hypothetical protein
MENKLTESVLACSGQSRARIPDAAKCRINKDVAGTLAMLLKLSTPFVYV